MSPVNTITSAFFNDVTSGLSEEQKSIPCKYLYDERGSALFDQICNLDEYYPTRTELGIMRTNASDIAAQIDTDAMLVEYGSGSSVKTRLLLDAVQELAAYVPVDISESHLLKTARRLRQAYPSLDVLPVVADFTKRFALPDCRRPYSHVALYFPGSTIGNFTPHEAGDLLRVIADLLGPQGGLLIGIDLQKDIPTIEAAYNDSQGVTAEFNLNLLTRMNDEFGSDFDLRQFEHLAVYDERHHRMDISLRSVVEQSVSFGSTDFQFEAGELIHTEYSHKYTIDGFAEFASNYGFSLHKAWTDERDYFGVLHLVID